MEEMTAQEMATDTRISAIESKVSAAEVDIDDHKGRIETLESKADITSKNVVSMDARLEVLETALENATAAEQGAEVQELETTKGTVEDRLTALETKLDTLIEQLMPRVHGLNV